MNIVIDGTSWMITKTDAFSGTVAAVDATRNLLGEITFVPFRSVGYITDGNTIVFDNDTEVPDELITQLTSR